MLTSSVSPEESGNDDGTTVSEDPLMPHQISYGSNMRTPSSISTASGLNLTLNVRVSTAPPRSDLTIHPNQPYLECSKPMAEVNLFHLKEEGDKQGHGDS
jgi:hypothetical protein